MAVLTTLHIANGDADAPRLRSTGYEHVLVWREALADGPVSPRPAELFPLRRSFVTTAYSSSEDEYQRVIESEFHSIINGRWDEVILHFDTDLFCCVNCVFLLSQLGAVPRIVWDLRTSTIELSTMDRAFLASCWRAYAGPDPTIIEDLLKQTPSKLSHIAVALRAHLERFPNVRTKLGRPQELIEELLARGLTEPEDLVQAFIALDDNVYGWGDAQILRERRSIETIRSGTAPMHIGGVTQRTTGPHWQWDPLKKRLVWSEE